MQPLNTLNETTSSGLSTEALSQHPWTEEPQTRDDRAESLGASISADTPWLSCTSSVSTLSGRCNERSLKSVSEKRSESKGSSTDGYQTVTCVCVGTDFSANVNQISCEAQSQVYNWAAHELTSESENNICSKMAKSKSVDTNSKKADNLIKPLVWPKRSELDERGSTSPNRKATKSSWKNSTSPGGSSGKEPYLDLPVEEYDKVESCESKGLKLTFRRKSSERVQTPPAQPKELKRRQPQGIPKLVVLKCKCPEGYSKKEIKCTVCQSDTRNKDLAEGDQPASKEFCGHTTKTVQNEDGDKGISDIRSQSTTIKTSDNLPVAPNQDESNAAHKLGVDNVKEMASRERHRKMSGTNDKTSERYNMNALESRSDKQSPSVQVLSKSLTTLPLQETQCDSESHTPPKKFDDTRSMQLSKFVSKSILTLSKNDTKPPSPKKDTKQMQPSHKNETKLTTTIPNSETKQTAPKGDTKPQTSTTLPKSNTTPPIHKSDTRLMPSSPRSGEKPPTSKIDIKPPTSKSDIKPMPPKAESDTKPRPPTPKSDIKPPTPKSDIKPPTPKYDIKPPTPKSDIKPMPPTPKSDIKPQTPKSDIKPPTPKSDIKPPTPKSGIKPPTPKSDIKPPASKSDTKQIPQTSKSDTKPLPQTSKSDTKPLPQASKSDTKPLPQTSKSDTKLLPQTSKSDTKPLPQTSKSDTKQIPQASKSDTKPLPQTSKSDTKPLPQTSKIDTKPLPQTSKSDTKPLPQTSKSDTKPLPQTSKSDTKPLPQTSKSDTKPLPQTSKSDTKPLPQTSKSDTKPLPQTSKSVTKSLPQTSKSDTKSLPQTSKSDTKSLPPATKSDLNTPTPKSNTKLMQFTSKGDTKPMPPASKSDAKPMPTTSKSDAKPLPTTSKSDTKTMPTTSKENTKPMQPSQKTDAKQLLPQRDTKPLTPKSEIKPPISKSETKPQTLESETKPPITKSETKPQTPKSDTKPLLSQRDTKPHSHKSESKLPTCEIDTKPLIPKVDTKTQIPQTNTIPSTPRMDSKPPTPKSETKLLPTSCKIDSKPLPSLSKRDSKSPLVLSKCDTILMSSLAKSVTVSISPLSKVKSNSMEIGTISPGQSSDGNARSMSVHELSERQKTKPELFYQNSAVIQKTVPKNIQQNCALPDIDSTKQANCIEVQTIARPTRNTISNATKEQEETPLDMLTHTSTLGDKPVNSVLVDEDSDVFLDAFSSFKRTSYRRSDSAPPPSMTFALTLAPPVALPESQSSPIDCSSNSQTLIDLLSLKKQTLLDRPKSSPPLSCFYFQTYNHGRKKKPVVMLDRLPSPVIELYSIKNLNGVQSTNKHVSVQSCSSKDNNGEREVSESDLSSSDFESRRKSSGKLKFTYTKVAHKRKYQIKTKRKPKKDTVVANVDSQGPGVEQTCRPTRKQYLRASKCGVRYINDDDILEEIMAASLLDDRFSSRCDLVNGPREGSCKGPRKPGRKRKLLPQEKASPKKKSPNQIIKTAVKDNLEGDAKNAFVDPKIKAMSAALIHAYEGNQNAEKIAFRKTPKGRRVGRPKNSDHNTTERKLGTKIRTHLTRKKLCFRRQQRTKPNAYVSYDSFPKCLRVDVYRSSDIASDVPTSKPSASGTECVRRPPELSSHNVKMRPPENHINLFESDVFNTRRAKEIIFNESTPQHITKTQHIIPHECRKAQNRHVQEYTKNQYLYAKEHGQLEQFCCSQDFGKTQHTFPQDQLTTQLLQSICRQCSHLEGEVNRGESDSCGHLNSRLVNCYSDRDAAESGVGKTCRCFQSLCQQHVSDDSPEVRSYTRSFLSGDRSCCNETSFDSDVVVKAEVVEPEVSPENYAVNEYAYFPDTRALDNRSFDCRNVDSRNVDSHNVDCRNVDSRNMDSRNVDSRALNIPKLAIDRDVDLMGLDYSKSEYVEDERPKGNTEDSERCTHSEHCDSELRCFDVWKIRALKGQCPYSYYLEVPVGHAPFDHASMQGNLLNQNTSTHSKPGQTTPTKSTDIPTQTHTSKSQNTLTKSSPSSVHNQSCLNKPLSIHISPSPEMSDYGSPPSLTECMPLWCPTKNALLNPDDTHKLCFAEDTCLCANKATGGCHYPEGHHQVKTLPKLSIPKITVSSPSSTNTQSNETPSSVSPSCVAYPSFLSPSLPHSRRIQRCCSPFRQPHYLASPSKQARDDFTKNNSQIIDDKSHSHLKLPSPRTNRCCSTKKNRRHGRLHTDTLMDSDDSDSTLVYPRADKRKQCCGRLPKSRRSSMGLSSVGISEGSPMSALSSPCIKGDDRAMSPDRQTIERRQTELSTMVSDLRESISKSKAMKRSRRTNSFSGDMYTKMSEQEIGSQRRTPKPMLERFMSVEAMMDSDTPYATITKRMSMGSKCEDMEMMTYVSGLCLRRKQEEANSTTGSVAETQIYGLDHTLSDTPSPKVSNAGCCPGIGIQEPVQIKTEPAEVSLETCPREIPGDAQDMVIDDSDSEERPLVVIENAESNEVLEGDEAFKKVTSGSYRLLAGTIKGFRGRSITNRRRRKTSGFLSVQTLFGRKATGKVIRPVRDGQLNRTKKKEAARNKIQVRNRDSAPVQSDTTRLSIEKPEMTLKRKIYKPRKTTNESGDLADNCTLKRRRKHTEGTVQSLSKAETSELLAEQINQSSAARILQELPRYNWLEQKILQKNSYVPASGAVSLSSPLVQDRGSGGSSSSTSRSATAGAAHPKSSLAKPGAKAAGEDGQEARSGKNPNNVSHGQAPGYILLGEDFKGVQSVDTASELTLNTCSDIRSMTTLSEKPSAVACDVLLTKADVNCVPPDLDYDMCPTSPESGLTIDLSHVEDTGRDARSPGGEVDEEELANTSSTAVQVKRASDDITNPACNDLTEPITSTPSSLPSSQLDLPTRLSDDTELSGGSVIKLQNVETKSTEKSGTSPAKSSASPDVCLAKTCMNAPDIAQTLAAQPITDMSLGTLSMQASSLSATPEVHEVPSTAGFDAQTAAAPGSGGGAGCSQQSRINSGVRPSSAATTTTNSNSMLSISEHMTTPSSTESCLVPLDLCLKKSESLTTTNSRAKGHPPVQMVLPQIQHKSISSPHMTPLPTSPVAVVGKSLVSPVHLTPELDPKQSDISGNDIVTSKQRSALGTEFKVETTYPLHVDTLDLCMKAPSVLKSLPGDQDDSSHLNESTADVAAIDERITIGLALSAELETEADRASKTKPLDVEASLRTLAQANVANVGTSLKPELLDMPISLSSSYQDISKTMTDAELDQEFQKHLIEFKALEKLAERKAQEQMQVAIMRKRKAAMLRIMEMKKAKRDFDRVGMLNTSCPESDKSKAAVMLKSSTVTLSNPTPLSNTITTAAATNISSSTLLSLCTTKWPGASSPSTLLDCTTKPTPLTQLCQTGAPDDVQENQTDMDVSNALPQMDEPTSVSKIKAEMIDCDTDSSLSLLKVECTNEFGQNSKSDQKETESQPQPMDIVSSESKSITENVIGNKTVTEQESSIEQEGCNDKEERGAKRSQNLLTPTPAHQNQPQLVHLDIRGPPAPTAYSLGPYNRRSVQINEPPFISKDTQKEDQPRKAHSQRPFQTAGNLIVLNSGTFSANGSSSSVKALLKQESLQALKSNVFRHSKPALQSSNKSYNRNMSQSEGVNISRATERSDVAFFRGQRKSLDDSDLKTQNRSIAKTVLDSGPKSADQVAKSYQPFHQGHTVADKRAISKSLESEAHHQQQIQPRPMMPQPYVPNITRPSERPLMLVDDAGDKKSAFKAHVKPHNNLVIDLTRDSRSSGNDPSLAQQGGPHLSSPMEDRLHLPKQDSGVRRIHGSLPVSGSRGNPPTEEIPSSIFPEFHAGHEKPSSLPNGFNTDRSRPGGFLTNQHRLPVRLERPIPVKDPVYMQEQMRPTMSTVAQHRQRYLDPAQEHHLNISGQSAGNKAYHKGSEELSPSYAASSHLMPSPSCWVDDQHHEFPSPHAPPHWRGHSPLATSRHTEMYGDVDIANRMLPDDLDKQRNRLDIHSTFQKHTDLTYKQKHFDASGGIGRQVINPSTQHPLTHPSLHAVSLHQQSMVLHSLQSRPPIPDPQTSLSDSYMRQQQQQQQHQGQQQQQQKSRALPPMDGTQASWRTYGSIDSLTPQSLQQRTAYVGNQTLNSSIQDPLAYQKLQQHQQMMQHQQHQHYQYQQLQVRPTQKISQNSSPTGQRMALPPSHPSQSVAIPQLMFSDCPSSQSSGVILPQNPSLHHRSNESEHLNLMRQRQFPHPIFDQRSCQPVPQSLAPPPAQAPSILQPKAPSSMTQMSSAPRVIYPAVGQALSQALNHPPSISSSQAMGHPSGATSSQTLGHQPNVTSSQAMAHPQSITNSLCRVCGNVAVYLCSSCRRVWYCNPHCQTKDWGVHATECKPTT